jgi:hypothetical protein
MARTKAIIARHNRYNGHKHANAPPDVGLTAGDAGIWHSRKMPPVSLRIRNPQEKVSMASLTGQYKSTVLLDFSGNFASFFPYSYAI